MINATLLIVLSALKLLHINPQNHPAI